MYYDFFHSLLFSYLKDSSENKVIIADKLYFCFAFLFYSCLLLKQLKEIY